MPASTVLLTTQYLEEADRLAHHVAVIDHGRLIAEGSPGELKADLSGDLVEFRVTDPGQRDRAVQAIAPLGRATAGTGRDSQQVTLPASAGTATLRTALRLLDDAWNRHRRPRHAAPPHPRRGLPRPHRAPGYPRRRQRPGRRRAVPPSPQGAPDDRPARRLAQDRRPPEHP